MGLLLGALLCHLLKLLQHAIKIARAHELVLVLLALLLLLRVLLSLALELFQELVHGLTKLLHQFRDFLVGGAAFESFGEFLLEFAQALFGSRQSAAVLDAQSDMPELINGAGNDLA